MEQEQQQLLYSLETVEPPLGLTELWNGSSWTEVNDLNTDKICRKYGFGTSTAA